MRRHAGSWIVLLALGAALLLAPCGRVSAAILPGAALTKDDVRAANLASPSITAADAAQLHLSRLIPNDTLFADQWHLENTGQTGGTIGADANVTAAWDIATGNGVVIGIVDDGLQYIHPDLAPNYDAGLSYDYFSDDSDPAPSSGDSHGTSAAGVAGAAGNNSLGVSGSAPDATLVGLRLIVGPTTDAQDADALGHMPDEIDIYSNSWGPPDDAAQLAGPGPLTLAALQNGVENGRDGLGNIYVWAAGNGLLANDNVNYDGFANSRYTIAVGAIDHNGVQTFYSEPGAPMLVTAYSSNDPGPGITTTTLVGEGNVADSGDFDYTDDFGGTSSATPLVSGVVALMLEANPGLTYRDVQHILVKTAEKNDPGDSDWTTNGAGHDINHKYGFGAVDAEAAVNEAVGWVHVGSESVISTGLRVVDTAIPDGIGEPGSGAIVADTLTINDLIIVEWVEIEFSATHPYRGDLELELVSPAGTSSILTEQHLNDENANIDAWTFTTARNWGEESLGGWTLNVSDGFIEDTGTWDSWELRLYGTGPGGSSGGDPPPTNGLEAGDANQNYRFDQVDIVTMIARGKYRNPIVPAQWGDGDFNGAPGGSAGNPPPGDGLFDQFDLILAALTGNYLQGDYRDMGENLQLSGNAKSLSAEPVELIADGVLGDDQVSILYNAATGEIFVDVPNGTMLTSINIASAAGIFTSDPALNVDELFDVDEDNTLFRFRLTQAIGSFSFGAVAQTGLSEEFLLADLSVVGSTLNLTGLGAVDLVYLAANAVPEPATGMLVGLGLLSIAFWRRRRANA